MGAHVLCGNSFTTKSYFAKLFDLTKNLELSYKFNNLDSTSSLDSLSQSNILVKCIGSWWYRTSFILSSTDKM